jgi:transcriptional regulator with XRE-family HTH domain
MAKKPIVFPTPEPGSLAYRFQELLAARRWTEKEFVKISGVGIRFVAEIKLGRIPTLVILSQVAATFGMDAETLMKGIRRTQFSAPMGKSVKTITLASCLVLLVVGFLPWWPLTVFLYAVFVACLLFSVTGYELENGVLVIQRLFWKTRVPLAGGTARALPRAMKGSLRLFGCGGLFSFTGLFTSRTLGRYRAWVSDSERTVVIETGGRKLVVSPDMPEQFVEAYAATQKQA